MNLKDVKLGLELTPSNAVQWFQRMELLLRSIDCWKVVNEGVGDEKLKDAARLAISCNVGDELIYLVNAAATPQQIWDALKKQFGEAKIVVAYELHTFSSLNREFIKEYAGTMDNADTAIVYLNPKNLKLNAADAFNEADIQKAFGNDQVQFVESDEALMNALIAAKSNQKQVFAFLSSGKFNLLDLQATADKLLS